MLFHSTCPGPLALTIFPAPLPQYILSIRYRGLLVDVSGGVSAFGGLIEKCLGQGLGILILAS